MQLSSDGLVSSSESTLISSRLSARPLCRAAVPVLAFCSAILGCLTVGDEPGISQETLAVANENFSQTYRPFLKKYCSECHFGASATAGVNLEVDLNVEGLLLHQKTWESVQRVLTEHEMPPDEAAQPHDEERAAFANWLDYVLNTLRCAGRTNPGAATLRRLNRTEYRNTIRDLVGIDYEPAEQFPGDDVGYGFDNIGDLLSVPPILLEKYLAAAEQIAAQAIVDTATLRIDRTFLGSDLDACDGAFVGENMMVVAENGTVATTTSLPFAGTYTVEIGATAHQAGKEPAKMQIVVNGQSAGEFEIKEPYDTIEVKSAEVDLSVGDVSIGAAFTNDFFDKDDLRAVGNDRNLLIASVRIKGPKTIDSENLSLANRRLLTVTPDEATSELDAARQIIPQWEQRAFRRQPTTEETQRLLGLFEMAKEQEATFEEAMRLVLQAILVSPHFLYKVEQPLPVDGASRALNDHELATSLSYFLWSTMPDDDLRGLADAQRLCDESSYREQVKRMLGDPKAGNLVNNFAVQWLQLRLLERATPNPELFPSFDLALRADMTRETLLCVRRIFEENESILRLLDDSQTFLNERLAVHYGVPGVVGDAFRRVDVAVQNRGGLLTQASVLTLSSYPDRTSPVKRGKWIMENLLGETPPPPDPAAMPLDERRELVGTLRQRMEQHRKDPNCAACHARMDPLGFALEHFDPIGRWRDHDGGGPIDASAAFPDGTTFHGAGELQQMLSGSARESFVRCFVEKLLTFALGRGLEYQDQCVVDEIIDRCAKDDFRIQTIILEVALSDPFRKRQSRGAE